MTSPKYTNINTCIDAQVALNLHDHNRASSSAIRVRVTPQEHNQIKSNANKLDMTISAYARLLTTMPLEIVENSTNNPGENATLLFNHTEIKKLRANIQVVGSNTNQITRAYNTIAQWEWAKDNEIKKQFGQINSCLNKIEEALPEIYQLLKEINSRQKVIL